MALRALQELEAKWCIKRVKVHHLEKPFVFAVAPFGASGIYTKESGFGVVGGFDLSHCSSETTSTSIKPSMQFQHRLIEAIAISGLYSEWITSICEAISQAHCGHFMKAHLSHQVPGIGACPAFT